MKPISTTIAATALLFSFLNSSVQAQNPPSDIEVESTETETDIISEEEKEDKPTRSYIGLGGTIGISGDATPLGEGGFSLVGRTAFTDNFSLHTSSVFQDDGLSLFAITFGIPIQNDASIEKFFPFAGAGIAVEDVFGDFDADALITTGVDVTLWQKIVGTVRFNVALAEDDPDFGLTLGIGYRFSIFDLF